VESSGLKINNLIFRANFWIMIAADIIIIGLAYFFAYLLRFDGDIPQNYKGLIEQTLFMVIALKLLIFYSFNLYGGMWRYTSLVDIFNIFRAVAISSATLTLLMILLFLGQGFSRSVLVLDFILTFLFVAGSRLSIRLLLHNRLNLFRLSNHASSINKKNLLIIGAGDAGEHILREIKENPKIHFKPIGFLDDDRSKWGQSIHGVKVLGDIDHIHKIKDKFDEILIAIPSATGEQMRLLVSICEKVGKPFKTMPRVGELIDGRVSMKVAREVTLSDVIGRDEVHLDDRRRGVYRIRTGAAG
jgi:FlaA1/EpsC-like NDP-sugar epimerase